MNYQEALTAMQNGEAVQRSGWNGKNMFIYLVPANNYPAQTEVAKVYFGDTVPYGAYIAMKTADENVVPWLAGQTDMQAKDWSVIVPTPKQ